MEPTSNIAGWEIIAAAAVFLIAYILLIAEKVHRAAIFLVGALLLLALGIVGWRDLPQLSLSWSAIPLVAGVMALAGAAGKTGIVAYAAVTSVRWAKGNPFIMLPALALLSAVGAVFLDGVAIVLLVVPVTLAIARQLQISPLPFVIAEMMAISIGGTSSMIGNLSNVMIGTANRHLTFNDFLAGLGPVSALALFVTTGLLLLVYRKRLKVGVKSGRKIMQRAMKLSVAEHVADRRLLVRSSLMLGATLLAFLLQPLLSDWLGLPVHPAAIALLGAALLLLFGLPRREAAEIVGQVDWKLLAFLAGLIVVVEGLAQVGSAGRLAEMLTVIAEGDLAFAAMLVLWISGIAAAAFDNMPYVAAMIPVVQQLGMQMGIEKPEGMNPVWWALALGSGLGGGATLIGASANVIAAGLAARQGERISYADYVKVGAPLALLSMLVATGYLYWFAL